MSRQERRAAARLAAVQALYQMDVAKKGINEILAEFESHWIGREVEGDQYNPAEIAFFRNILEGVLAEQGEVDVKDVPARVAITEYTDIAGAFFGGEEVGMVNGVLDSLARRLRPDELVGAGR